MRIGEFAKRAGVSASKVRFYEARGLLPPAGRSANGYRRYGAADLGVVSFIDRARSLGVSLSDIALFMSRPAEERRAKHGLVRALEAKIAEIDEHLAAAQARRGEVAALLAELRGRSHG
jgi:MerR family copper efflux transcriptional regulator/MerR family gold-responsive transcriptional activator of gol and ges genes